MHRRKGSTTEPEIFSVAKISCSGDSTWNLKTLRRRFLLIHVHTRSSLTHQIVKSDESFARLMFVVLYHLKTMQKCSRHEAFRIYSTSFNIRSTKLLSVPGKIFELRNKARPARRRPDLLEEGQFLKFKLRSHRTYIIALPKFQAWKPGQIC